MKNKIRLLLADDQTLFRNMLEELLSKNPIFDILGAACNGEEAIKMASKLKPDIILMDIKMPEKSGIDALRTIKSSGDNIKVIMLTTFEDSISITEACALGADGYLLKDIKPEVLSLSIQCVHNDIVTIHRNAYEFIWPKSTGISSPKDKFTINDIILDGVDISIIRSIGEGLKNKEIASLLNYSEGSIKNRISKILNAIGASDRTQITLFAIKNNII